MPSTWQSSSTWESFLTSQGAGQHDSFRIFADADLEPPPPGTLQLYDVSELGCLWLEGKDATKFLQGQLTCDLGEVSAAQFRRGAICNLQGRMICSFRIFQTAPESYGLLMHRDLLESVQQWLAKYIVFSKATIRVDDSHVGVGISGSPPAQVNIPTMPSGEQASAALEHGIALRISASRWLLLLQPEYAETIWRELASTAVIADQRHWTLQNIRDGLAEITPETAGEFIPQMINLQDKGGVSFKKGCYIGQEVVARMQYLGKLKRHMQHAKLVASHHPRPGDPLFSPGSTQSIGNIINAAPIGPDTFEALVVVTDAAREADAVYHSSDFDEKLHFLSPPYAITK